MEDKVLTFNDFRKEQKKREFKEKVQTKLQNGMEFIAQNKKELITLIPIVVGGVTTVSKVVGKHINLNKQENIKNLYCYDRSGGHYWRLRRELSNKEWLEIDKRKQNGERIADILNDMKVLK